MRKRYQSWCENEIYFFQDLVRKRSNLVRKRYYILFTRYISTNQPILQNWLHSPTSSYIPWHSKFSSVQCVTFFLFAKMSHWSLFFGAKRHSQYLLVDLCCEIVIIRIIWCEIINMVIKHCQSGRTFCCQIRTFCCEKGLIWC